jgi:hypothetical protein
MDGDSGQIVAIRRCYRIYSKPTKEQNNHSIKLNKGVRGGVSDIDKSEDSSFKAALSYYQLGGSRSKQGMFILLIFVSSVIYVMIKQMGFTNFKDVFVADLIFKLIFVFPIYLLYLVFKNDKPDEEA